jgi:hypothetical protein
VREKESIASEIFYTVRVLQKNRISSKEILRILSDGK